MRENHYFLGFVIDLFDSHSLLFPMRNSLTRLFLNEIIILRTNIIQINRVSSLFFYLNTPEKLQEISIMNIVCW